MTPGSPNQLRHLDGRGGNDRRDAFQDLPGSNYHRHQQGVGIDRLRQVYLDWLSPGQADREGRSLQRILSLPLRPADQ